MRVSGSLNELQKKKNEGGRKFIIIYYFYEVWSEAGLRNPVWKFIFSTSRILQSDLLLTRTIIGIFVDCALPDTHASHLSRQYTRQTHFLRYS